MKYKNRQNKKNKQKKQNNVGLISVVFIAMLSSVASVCLYDMYLGVDVTGYQNTNYSPMKASVNEVKEEEIEKNTEIENMIEEASKTIVGISKVKNTGTSIFLKDSAETLGLGTGVIVSENGYVVTNYHVAGNKYSTCYVTLGDGEVCNGMVVWADKDTDLAIVKIDKRNLEYINLGESTDLRPGQPVYAIGNPIGFEFQKTVTSGIVSAINRTIKLEEEESVTYMTDLIQTDATINPR